MKAATTFAADRSLLWHDEGHSELSGGVLTVDSRRWPTMDVEKREHRFRVLDASIARQFVVRGPACRTRTTS